MPGAVITARSVDTNQIRRSSSSGDGTYRFGALPAGDYEIRAEFQGFSPYVNPIVTIMLGRTSVLHIILNPAGVSADVAVTDQPPPIDPSATATTTTIDPERIEELPVNSRNYLDFTLLAPGVAASNSQSRTASLADSGFTFGGLRPRSNSISIDGLDNTDETTGAARVALSPEIVREFQIINSGLSAESGGAAGGAINVVTKTGTNDIHGDTFLFGQNERFNAQESVAAQAGAGTPRFRRYQPDSPWAGLSSPTASSSTSPVNRNTSPKTALRRFCPRSGRGSTRPWILERLQDWRLDRFSPDAFRPARTKPKQQEN